MREIYFITYFRLLTYLSQHSLTLALDRWTSGVINLFNLFVFLLHHKFGCDNKEYMHCIMLQHPDKSTFTTDLISKKQKIFMEAENPKFI
ncbi:unnamed protein product [Rhizophagus irregularis]|nr:unnamed protein product [Rhizophagus irregularis]CAB5386968.1 unnamed protein product [Rhizophagus irregularis]